ncbi:hypothetical protein Purlil1_13040 [Purpureocillium lilacinum]|uniref:Uncharacterized protein n=1 Tax=Purpureocillium lilacinum TaxID=33203 RepID=A0ABR0BFT8_PURLI|nr:hypothetical protein Purlil1_13040 [Purpureocillium lilacinum]
MRLIGRRWALSGSVADGGDVSSPAALSSPDMRSENRARDLANPRESTKLRGITGKADWFQYRRPRGRSLSGNDITLQLRSGRGIRRHPRRRQPPPPSAHTPWKVVASHPVQSALFDHFPSLWHLAAACEEYSDEISFRALPSQSEFRLRANRLYYAKSWAEAARTSTLSPSQMFVGPKYIRQYAELAAGPGCLSCLQHIVFHPRTLPQGFLAVQTYLSILMSRLSVSGASRLTANNRRGGVICGWFGMLLRKGVSRLALSCHTSPSVADTT